MDNSFVCAFIGLICVLGTDTLGLVHVIALALKFELEQTGHSTFARKHFENNLIVVLSALFLRLWSLIRLQLGFICFLFQHITSEQPNVPPVATASSLSFTAIIVPGSVFLILHTCVFCFPHFLCTWWHAHWPPGSVSISSSVSFFVLSTCLSASFSQSVTQFTWTRCILLLTRLNWKTVPIILLTSLKLRMWRAYSSAGPKEATAHKIDQFHVEKRCQNSPWHLFPLVCFLRATD